MQKARARRWMWIAIAVVCAAIGCLRLLSWPVTRTGPHSSRPGEPELTGRAPDSSSADAGSSASTSTPSAALDLASRSYLGRGKPIPPEVERLRVRVRDSLGDRRRDSASEVPVGTGPKASAAEQKLGALKDRTGELNPETMHVLNHEFMPLVRECYDQAHERNPLLRGMLAVSLELAGAEELGTIVTGVEPAADLNQLADDELIECVRQSAFSIQLPMPLKSGYVSRQLTMRFGDRER